LAWRRLTQRDNQMASAAAAILQLNRVWLAAWLHQRDIGSHGA